MSLKPPLIVRRVQGQSMLPLLPPGAIIVARRLKPPALKPGMLIILAHQGREKIKRIESITGDTIFVTGDNKAHSTDSRHFGPLDTNCVLAKIIWPIRAPKTQESKI